MPRYIFTLIFCLFISPVLAANSIQELQQQIAGKDYSAAARNGEKLLLDNPGHTWARFLTAYAHQQSNQMTRAIELYEDLISDHPGLPEPRNNLALIFISIGLKGYGKQKRGDQKTPIGIYHVTRYIDGEELPDLDAFGRDFKSWDGHKRWVDRDKSRVAVDYQNLNIFNYPAEENLVLMQFKQSYRSNNLDVDSAKEIYWHKADDQWQIVYEGIRQFPVPDTSIVEI